MTDQEYTGAHGQYATFELNQHKNLKIILTEEGKQELSDLLGTKNHEEILYELVEDILCNSEWEKPAPEEVGALTDSPIFAFGMCRDDDGSVVADKSTRYFWYPEYQVCDELAELLDKGFIVFTKAL